MGADSSAFDASVRIQLEGAIPEIVSGRFGIDALRNNLSLKTRERRGLILRQPEDFVQTNHPENLSDLF